MGDMADDLIYREHHSFRANGIDQPKRRKTPKKEKSLGELLYSASQEIIKKKNNHAK